MQQITRWDDLVGKTITGVNELHEVLILGEEYCAFKPGGWDREDVIISDELLSPHALLHLGFIDEEECGKLVANENARHKAWGKKMDLETLARLKAKYEEK